MLILTHRPGETLIIELPTGERITVTVLEVKGNQVSIGTNAPDDMGLRDALPGHGIRKVYKTRVEVYKAA